MNVLAVAGTALAAGVWAVASIGAYHVFADHALSVEYVCAGPGHYLPDPGPPPNYHPPPSMPMFPGHAMPPVPRPPSAKP